MTPTTDRARTAPLFSFIAGEAFRTKLVVDGILYDLDLITTDATDVIKSQAQPDLVYHVSSLSFWLYQKGVRKYEGNL
jgi:hypothetical protein